MFRKSMHRGHQPFGLSKRSDLPSRHGLLRAGILVACWVIVGGSSIFAGSLDVLSGARYWDDYGMRVTLDNTNACYVQDDLPMAESRYRCRFYFRLNHLNLSEGEGFILFAAYDQSDRIQLSIEIGRDSGQTKLHGRLRQNDGTYLETNPATDPVIAEGWQALELDWQALSGTGTLALTLNGNAISGIVNATNDQGQIDTVRWGAVEGNGASSSGFFDLDYFESRRNTAIGLKCHDAGAVGAALEAWEPQYSMTDLIQIFNARCP